MGSTSATTRSRRGRGMGDLLAAWLMVVAFAIVVVLPSPTCAFRHNYRTKNDGRSLIGPIGFPFGFTSTGHFNLTVFGFDLTVHDDGDHGDDPDHGRVTTDDFYSNNNDNRGRQLELVDDILGVGFLLKRFSDESDFNHYLNLLAANDTRCAFLPYIENYALEDDFFANSEGENDDYYITGNGELLEEVSETGLFLNMQSTGRWAPHTATVSYDFQAGDEGLYFLIFQLCGAPPDSDIHAQFELDIHHSNLDVFGNESYLSAGEMALPHMFFYFSVVYAVCLCIWFSNIRLIGQGNGGHFEPDSDDASHKPIVFPIHHLMTVLLTLKFLALFFESIRYHFLRVLGQAKGWSGIYYTFAFLKGTFLFTVILLLGSGWSFVKPFLSDREKSMACAILGLQVVNNLAILVLQHLAEGEHAYDRWTAILHMVDILCCCAVLIPIVWQVNALETNMELVSSTPEDDEIIDFQEDMRLPEDEFEEAVPGDGHSGDVRLVSKLKLFRRFYLLVIGYIYMTRIVVYLFASMLDYRHTWVRHFVIEAVTLAFYVTVGMQFRPMPENPYLTVPVPSSSSSRNGTGNGRKEIELQTKPKKFKD